MEAVVSSIDIERPAAEVYAYATDPTRFPTLRDVAGVGECSLIISRNRLALGTPRRSGPGA